MNSKKRIALIVICSLLLIFSLMSFSVSANLADSNQSTEEELEQYLAEFVAKLGIPGMSIAISRHGDLIYNQVFGEDVNNETRFYIGSITKSFTALGIMQLVEQGKINLDESVSTYLPEFRVSDEITVRHLLHHVSGMTEFGYIAKLDPLSDFYDLVSDMNKMSLSYVPGEKFSYFNPNYSLLGFVIERVSGQSYVEYIEENIILPLELTNTSVRGDVDVDGHLSFFGLSIKRAEKYIKYDLPAGFMTSTAQDLILYLDALTQRNPALGVSEEGMEEMMTGDFYNMGWINSEIANRPAIHHGGSLPGFSANAVMLTEDGYNIAFLLNKNHLINGMTFNPDLTKGLVSILTEQTPPTRLSYMWLLRLLIIPFVLTTFLNTRKVIRLVKSDDLPTQKRIPAAILHLFLPIATITLLPLAAGFITQRGMTWELAFLMMPDMITWLFLGLAFGVTEACIHIVYIFKTICYKQ